MATYPLLEGVDSIHDFYCRLLVVCLPDNKRLGFSIVRETHVCFLTFPFYTPAIFTLSCLHVTKRRKKSQKSRLTWPKYSRKYSEIKDTENKFPLHMFISLKNVQPHSCCNLIPLKSFSLHICTYIYYFPKTIRKCFTLNYLLTTLSTLLCRLLGKKC